MENEKLFSCIYLFYTHLNTQLYFGLLFLFFMLWLSAPVAEQLTNLNNKLLEGKEQVYVGRNCHTLTNSIKIALLKDLPVIWICLIPLQYLSAILILLVLSLLADKFLPSFTAQVNPTISMMLSPFPVGKSLVTIVLVLSTFVSYIIMPGCARTGLEQQCQWGVGEQTYLIAITLTPLLSY